MVDAVESMCRAMGVGRETALNRATNIVGGALGLGRERLSGGDEGGGERERAVGRPQVGSNNSAAVKLDDSRSTAKVQAVTNLEEMVL